MAKDKRTPMSTDMNDVDLSSDALTDDERERLQQTMSEADESPDQKAM